MHIFQALDRNYVFDTGSGSLFEIDEVALAVLELWPAFSTKQIMAELEGRFSSVSIEEAANELSDMLSDGVLNSEIPLEPSASNAVPEVKALCLHVAHDCNLRCLYCFAGTGNFGGERTMMDFETGKAAIDFLLKSSGSRRNLEVDFFGGEPLLNFQVVKQIVAYGEKVQTEHGKNIRFTLTTNATLLGKEEIDFLNEKKMAVVVSLDGRPEINDRMRPFNGGHGSHESVSKAIVDFVKSRDTKNYYVRGTFTRHNLDFTKDIEHLYALGLREISLEPVVAAEKEDYAIRSEHLPRLFLEYDKLARFYLDKEASGDGFNFFHFNMATYNGPCFAKRVTGCGAGYDYVAITPEGELYPCHQFVGQEQFKLGNVFLGIENFSLSARFRAANLYHKEDCSSCWARFLCSGGCHANAYYANGDLLSPDQISCALQKKRIECSLALVARKTV
ncbi:MAG: thioether cross-link-forming SCIFF peptide maturase [bacterium]|nr:thioether cross-link-forming SCIFF peptide maturase [bacterium]